VPAADTVPFMFSAIVVGTDGSETADRALARAFAMARLTQARLHVVSAYAPTPARVTGGAPAAEAAEWQVGSDFEVRAVLDRALGQARSEDVEVEVHSPKGDPADAILAVATQTGADLIVLGSRGMQGPRRVLGSVPNKVSHRAPCDLLIVQTT
jgi:nucleotide-binding universal stress UspA family protein